MVDIVNDADLLAQVEEVAYGREYIFNSDVSGDKLLSAGLDKARQLFLVACRCLEDIAEDCETDVLVYAESLNVHVAGVNPDVHHAVAGNADDSVLALWVVNCNVDNACILYFKSLLAGDDVALVREYLTSHRSDDGFCYLSAVNSVGDSKLLVVLVTSKSGEVVSLCVEELVVEVVLRGLNAGHVAGVELSVDLEESLFLVLGAVLLDGGENSGVLTELGGELSVGRKAQRTQERGNGDLSVLIYADIVDVVCVHLILEPCAAVRDNGSLVEGLTGLVVLEAVVHAG
ncbi:uncharacterized protein BN782_00856 [Eubacterium sp. CAG:786]|nr:uncharacterized protein BN782_00856 [Eubacterium sp. CAG:786]